MRRREMLALTVLGAASFAAPASACRAPVAKDRDGYGRAINALVRAWWDRDYSAFSRAFEHPNVPTPFNARGVFDEYFQRNEPRQIGSILFNGPSAVVQIITPRGPDHEHGICGGHARADLILVKFYPGLSEPVVAELRYLGYDTLAASEWESAVLARPVA